MDSDTQSFVPSYRPQLRLDLKVLGGLAVCIVLIRFKALTHLTSAVLGGSDADSGLYLWLSRINFNNLFESPWFNTPAFYPYAKSLAWSDNFLLPSMLAGILNLILPDLLTYNLILLGAHFLNGFLTYRLAYRLTGSALPSFFSGTAFMSCGYLSSQLGHPQLQFVFWLPAALLLLLRYLHTCSIVTSILLGLSVLGAFLTTVYYSVFQCILLLGFFTALLIMRPALFRSATIFRLLCGFLVGLSPVLFFLTPYLDVRSTFGARGIYESYYFSAHALSYLSASPFSLLYSFTSGLSDAEALLFPGLTILALSTLAFTRMTSAKPLRLHTSVFIFSLFATLAFSALPSFTAKWAEPENLLRLNEQIRYVCALAGWLCLASFAGLLYRMAKLERKLGTSIITHRAATGALLFTALLCLLISFGPLGNPERGEYALGVFRLFYEAMPGFNSIRAISRIGVVVVFCFCVVCAFPLARLTKSNRMPLGAVAALLPIIIAENMLTTYPLDPPAARPAIFSSLITRAESDDAVAVIPFTDELHNGSVKSWRQFATYNMRYMNWLADAQLKTINGYSGQRSKVMLEYPRKLSGFPDQRSITALSTIPDLKYVVYISSYDPGFDRERMMKSLDSFKRSVRLIESDLAGNYLFEITPVTDLNKPFFLRVPSYPSGTISFELMTPRETDAPKRVIEIFRFDISDNSPLATIEIKADGSWQQFTLEMPEVEPAVSPILIAFSVRAGHTVFLRSAKFR